MSLLEGLNPQQKEAVENTNQHLRIIAGAGSGKTRVVTTRIAHLISNCNVLSHRILAITFTNKAAKEMKDRVMKLLSYESAGVQVSTIHSFCVRILKEDIYHLGYPRNFTILDMDDQKSILKEAYKEYNIDVKAYSYNNVLNYISANKINFIDATMAKARANGFEMEEIKANIFQFYEERLAQMKALDFDDLLIFTYHLLKENKEIRSKWQNRFDYIHVDEFQDVDTLQYAIIRYLCREDAILCVVGDPDQTIYTWRGANVDIIMSFEKDFPNTKTIVLNQNYRSTQYILNGANGLIKNNRNRIDKDLFTNKQSQDKITYFSAMDEYSESLWVANRIKQLHEQGVPYSDIAILYRSNYLSRQLEKAFLDTQLPYIIYGGIRFYERAEIKDALCYLRLLSKPTQEDPKEMWKDLAIKRVINSPRRGVGAKTMESLEMFARSNGINLYEALKIYPDKKGKAKKALEQFVNTIEECKLLVDEISLDTLLHTILEKSGYLAMLEEEKEIERLENIKELQHDIEIFIINNENATLDDYLQMISLYTDKQEDKSESVSLMTIHASKGLEFPYVFIYSFCEGIFPSERSVNEGGTAALEEERRLAYVAITRAMDKLYISNSQEYSPMLDRLKMPSCFIKEIPVDSFENTNQIYNQSRYTSSFQYYEESMVDEPISKLEKPKQSQQKIRKGDLVAHTTFKEGIVVSVVEGLATIAFDKKFGIRKIMANHPSLKKIIKDR